MEGISETQLQNDPYIIKRVNFGKRKLLHVQYHPSLVQLCDASPHNLFDALQ